MPSGDLFASARRKIDRASKHIQEASETLREKRPFRYTLETNAITCQRSVGAEKDEPVIQDIATICGDAVHNLRSALDHAYTAIVVPFAKSDRERRAVQFPVSETAARLEESVKNRLAHRVSPEFFDAIMQLRPHGEAGGNELLYLIHVFDIPDKHAAFIPTADYTEVTGEIIRRFAPDCPLPPGAQLSFGQNRRDIGWSFRLPGMFSWQAFGFPAHGILKQEIDVPVNIVFKVDPMHPSMLLVPTLHQFVDVTKTVVEIIAGFA